MFVSKMAIDRRTVLRGMGATLALPLLDAMVPALSDLLRRMRFGASMCPTASSWRTGRRQRRVPGSNSPRS